MQGLALKKNGSNDKLLYVNPPPVRPPLPEKKLHGRYVDGGKAVKSISWVPESVSVVLNKRPVSLVL